MNEEQRIQMKMDAANALAQRVPHLNFWCNNCDQDTLREPWTEHDLELLGAGEHVTPTCLRCGEAYQCGECGYEIDDMGNCQRPEGHEPAE